MKFEFGVRVLSFVFLVAGFSAMAGSVKWEMPNTYPKSDAEHRQWTNVVLRVDNPFVCCGEVQETEKRIDILWADYTNRMERAARMYEKRRAAAERRTAEQARREALRRMSRRGAK